MTDEPSFGERLRQLRIAAGLTQEALATRSGLSVRGISDLERGVRRRPQRETIRMLAEALGVAVHEFRVERPQHDSRATVPVPNRRPAPVPLTSFVGRERDVARITELLRDPGVRLVTLTGPGGVGKTRLAIEISGAIAHDFRDGIMFVELSSVADPALVPATIAQSLGVREAESLPIVESLKAALRDHQMLLVLDNFEQVVDAATSLISLLGHCPQLKMLVTSRISLHISGEHEFEVSPLELPHVSSTASAEKLIQYPAVALFAQRARAANAHFDFSAGTAATVAALCRRLDGLPLAIELAAARVKLLSPSTILEHLQRPLTVLTDGFRDLPERQRTIRATIAWSFNLLDAEHQALLCRLSVFVGGWTVDAAEAVVGVTRTSDVIDGLATLVDHHLVRRVDVPDGNVRFTMLDTICEFAVEQLAQRGEEHETRQRHARYFVELAERAAAGLTGPQQLTWLTRLTTEHDNLRAVLKWAYIQDDVELGLRVSTSLWFFWFTRGFLNEGRNWLERLVTPDRSVPTPVWVQGLISAGSLAFYFGDYDAAKKLLEESLPLVRESGDTDSLVAVLTYLGYVAVLGMRHDIPLDEIVEEASRHIHHLTNRRIEADWMVLTALVEAVRGNLDRALQGLEEALAAYQSIGDLQGTCMCLTNLGFGALVGGDYQSAESILRENLRLATDVDYKISIGYCLIGLGIIANFELNPRRAARLFAAADVVEQTSGIHLTKFARTVLQYDQVLATVRTQLGDDAWQSAYNNGASMAESDAIAYALQGSDHDDTG